MANTIDRIKVAEEERLISPHASNVPIQDVGTWKPKNTQAAIEQLHTELGNKQSTLVDGETIKSINGRSLLGEGNIEIKEEHLIEKTYAPAEFSGLGRKYLQKNIVSDKNVLTQAMMQDANTIYVIQYDYDLNGQSITVPSGCVLQFEGGSLSNGTLVGNDTAIKADIIKIFSTDVTLSGSWSVDISYAEWFGAVGDGVTDDSTAFNKTIQYLGKQRLTLLPKIYAIAASIDITRSNIMITGVGPASTFKKLFDGDAITCSLSKIKYTTIQNLSILGNNHSGSGIKSESNHLSSIRIIDVFINRCDYGIYLNNAYVVRINKGQISTCGTGIFLDSCHGSSIHEVAVTTCTDTCVFIGGGTYGTSVTNSCLQEAEVGVRIGNAYGITIANNYLEKTAKCFEIGYNNAECSNINISGGTSTSLGKDDTANIGVVIYNGKYISIDTIYISSVHTMIKTGDSSGIKEVVVKNIFGGIFTKRFDVYNWKVVKYINTSSIGKDSDMPSNAQEGTIFFNESLQTLCIKRNNYWTDVFGQIAHLTKGTTAERPTLGSNYDNNSALYYDRTLGTFIYWNGYRWKKMDGYEALARVGTWSDRPSPMPSASGYMYFNTDDARPMYWYNSKWYSADGAIANVKRNGTTAQRPASVDIYVGFQYWDTDLGKMIAWNGNAWVNLDGTALA